MMAFPIGNKARNLKLTFSNGYRYVSTWSPLATAFNTRPGQKLNISFSKENKGLFGLKELRSYDGFYLMKENVINASSELVSEALSPHRSRKMVNVFDELSNTLCSVADLAEFVRIAHPDRMFTTAAEEACITISYEVEKLNTNKDLYLSVKNVLEKGDVVPTNSVDDHVSSLFLFDFEQSGIHLPDRKREEVVALNDYILQLGQKFMAGANTSREVSKDLIPSNLRHLFNTDGNNAIVSGLFGDSIESAREIAYKIFLSPDPGQEQLLGHILASRFRLAQLCGFPTYSHKALKSSLAENPSNVWNFLVEINEKIRPKVRSDYDKMFQIKKEEDPICKPLALWDVPYVTNAAKKGWLKNSQYTAYFPLGSCMEGLSNLLQSLYGISLINETVEPGETWDSDIYKLAVVHEKEGFLGNIYCDFYERSNKPNQDCHFTVQGGRRLADGSYQNPIVVVMLNLPLPRWSTPCLLSPSMVDNLFHEMGHAMHSMLARTEYQHISGTRCTTDFAEVPSVLMEYFASDPRVVRTFAKHYKTGEPMPEDMLLKMCQAKHIFQSSEIQVQIFYSLLDQVYHGEYPLKGTTTEVLAALQNEHCELQYVPNTAWQLRFSHLVGYGAKYYSYLMSKAVASSIWQTMFSKDPLSRIQGERYRTECLAHGGGKPPKELIQDLLKIPVTPQFMASAIINNLEDCPIV